MPFPQPSSSFCLESGLSKGLTAVWWVPLGWCIASDVCPDWLPPALEFAFCILSVLPCTRFLFMKSTADLIIRKVGVDWLWGIDKMLLFLLIKGSQSSAAHLRSWKLALCSEALSLPGVWHAWWPLRSQSLSLFRRMTCHLLQQPHYLYRVNKFLLIFLSFQESLCLTCLCYKFVAVCTCISNCWL